MTKKIDCISAISIDMGAVDTGVFYTTYGPGEDIREADLHGACIHVSEFKVSQQSRLAKRHQRRGYKRRKLARRLLLLILKEAYGVKEMDLAEQNFLFGLLKRRGFSYLSEELSFELLGNLSAGDVESFFDNFLDGQDNTSVYEELLAKSKDRDWIEAFFQHIEAGDFSHQGVKAKIKALGNEMVIEDSALLLQQVRAIADYIKSCRNEIIDGARHRRDYLTNIHADIKATFSKLPNLKKSKLKAEQLFRLVGNISNLQLRVLRKYFNDEAMQKGDYWDPARLQIQLRRWFKGWRPDNPDQKTNQYKHVQALRSNNTDVLAWLTTVDPLTTIPPFEDQNNRRISQCRALILDPDLLDSQYPDWRKWVQSLQSYLSKHHNDSDFDPATDLNGKSIELQTEDAAARILQRILDASQAIDIFLIRFQVTGRGSINKREQKDANKRLKDALGDGYSGFMELAVDYFEDVERARSGILEQKGRGQVLGNVVKTCPTKTKKKSNIRAVLAGQILGYPELNEDVLHEFLNNGWQEKHGRTTLRGYCRKIEELRKRDGTNFISTVNRIRRALIDKKKHNITPDFDQADKEVAGLIEKLDEMVMALARGMPDYLAKFLERLNKTEDKLVVSDFPFANLFSMAQLYNVIEGDSGGYSTTCATCTEENQWRSTVMTLNQGQTRAARASRLPANAVKPFDGMLKRVLERQAREIALLKRKELASQKLRKVKLLSIPVIVEQNTFDFMSDIATLKRAESMTKQANTAKDRAEKLEKNTNNLFMRKEQRIKAAAAGISAYSGNKLSDKGGEIDHIIPRSKSQSVNGTIFNSEMNLIYVSRNDNQRRGNRDYSLEQLAGAYLKKQFGTTDLASVRSMIEEGLDSYEKRKRRGAFHSLPVAEQRALRHSLFDSELRERVLDLLNTQTMTKVNGTQAFFVSVLMKELRFHIGKILPDTEIQFKVLRPHADDFSELRKSILTTHYPELKKPTREEGGQRPGSHVIDATMALAACLRFERTANELQAVGLDLDISDAELAADLKTLIPQSLKIIDVRSLPKYRKPNLGSASLFKDGIYGERFLPLMVHAKKLYIGFAKKNAITVKKGARELYDLMKPFLRSKQPLPAFEELLEKVGKKCYILGIDRPAAMQYMLQVKNPTDPVYSVLEGLRYSVAKENLESVLLEQNGKLKAPANLITDKDFYIKFSVKIPVAGKNETVGGELIYPEKSKWQQLGKQIRKAKQFKVGQVVDSLELRNWLRAEVFPDTIELNKKHKGVRKVFSLPKPKYPSGALRIRRSVYPDGHLFQMVEADSGLYAGFNVENGRPDLSQNGLLPLPALTAGDNVLIPGIGPVNPENMVFMDEWRRLPVEDDPALKGLWFAPWSGGRGKIRAAIDVTEFKKLIAGKTTENIMLKGDDSIQAFPFQLTLKENYGNILERLHNTLKKPRNKIQLVALNSNIIVVEYILGSTNNNHRDLYSQGQAVEPDEAYNYIGTG